MTHSPGRSRIVEASNERVRAIYGAVLGRRRQKLTTPALAHGLLAG